MYLIHSRFLYFSCVPFESDTPKIFLLFKMMIIDANMNGIECRINSFVLMADIPQTGSLARSK